MEFAQAGVEGSGVITIYTIQHMNLGIPTRIVLFDALHKTNRVNTTLVGSPKITYHIANANNGIILQLVFSLDLLAAHVTNPIR